MVLHKLSKKVAMPTGITMILAAVLLVMLSASGSGHVATEVNQIIQPEIKTSTLWGIYIQDVNTGQVLFEHNANKALLPASTQKLLTSAGALTTLGPDFRYETRLYFNGKVEGDVMRGDLILKGSGDPSFGSVETGQPDPLRGWARALSSLGVRRFEGRIIGDDDVFDDAPYAEGWDVDYLTSQSSRLMGVSTSGLAYHDNVVEVRVQKSDSGQVVEVIPPGFKSDINKVLAAGRPGGSGPGHITVTGNIPPTFNGALTLPVTDPTIMAVHSFTQYLRDAGIGLSTTVHDMDDFPKNLSYDNAELLFVHVSPPLSSLIAILNKESNNFYAEQLFRTFSYGGGTQGAGQRVKQLLSKAGVQTETITIKDGSGLSRKDLVTPQAFGKLLAYMYKQPERDAFLQSLARGGERGSTLGGRLSDVEVFAKTGSLDQVRALSGYTTTADGRLVAFSVFANNFSGSGSRINHVIDEIVRAAAGRTS